MKWFDEVVEERLVMKNCANIMCDNPKIQEKTI